MKLIIAIFFTAILGACSSAHRVNGWYPVADIPENKIEGNVIVTTKDFDVVNLDTVSFFDMAIIEGKLKAGKVKSGLMPLKIESVKEWASCSMTR